LFNKFEKSTQEIKERLTSNQTPSSPLSHPNLQI
jgi:hypothetical protein